MENIFECYNKVIETYHNINMAILDGGGSFLLKESGHLSPNINEYFDCFEKACIDYINSGKRDFVLHEDIFGNLNRFFNKIDIIKKFHLVII